jgi:hypothetical protein
MMMDDLRHKSAGFELNRFFVISLFMKYYNQLDYLYSFLVFYIKFKFLENFMTIIILIWV